MPAAATTQNDPGGYVRHFEEISRTRSEAAWLRTLRERALAEFARQGFPTTQQEAWKYTDVSSLARAPPAPYAPRGPEPPTDIAAHSLASLGAAEYVFINGRLDPTRSAGAASNGAKVQTLREAANRSGLDDQLGRLADARTNPFVALNAAFFADGTVIEIPRGAVLERPIHLLHLTTGEAKGSLVAPRTLIIAGEASQASIIESYAGPDATPILSVPVTEIVAGPSAVVDHVKIQREGNEATHVGSLDVRQDRASNVRAHLYTTGARLARHDVNVVFAGEGAESTLNGLYVLGGSQHTDIHTTIDHATPHCTSREFYKGILDGRSRGVFYGKVLVRKGAQKTDANQTNKNLLLSDGALADSTPALEINADDVKCGHGSTIGQLDKNQLFYLRSRGVPEDTARGILVHAFARDVLSRFQPETLRPILGESLLRRFPHGERIQEALREIE